VQDFKIAILVLNYNGLRYLRSLFESALFLKNCSEVDLILVDNASWDDSVRFVSEQFPWVRVIRNDKNYGWGEGYNQAIQVLRQQGVNYSHYLFLNNDVFVSEQWWLEFKNGILNSPKSVAEWGCRAVFAAPFVVEDLFSIAPSSGKPMALTTQFYHHDLASFDRKNETFKVRLQPRKHIPTNESKLLAVHDFEYTLRVFEPNGEPFTLELAVGLEFECVDEAPSRKAIRVFTRGAPGNALRAKVSLNKGQSLIIERHLWESRNDLKLLIQNSGSGLNGVFEGYDLHCYEPQNSPQSHDQVAAICGVCKAVKADVFHEICGFDPAFFMYYEDTDFSLRLRKRDYQTRIIEKAILRHIHGGSSGVFSPFFIRQVAWSLLYFHMRHASFYRRMRTLLKCCYYALLEQLDDTYLPAKVNRNALQLLKRRFFNRLGGVG